MIEVEGLTKRFGKVEALRGVSFGAADGRITGFLGPNGTGKSTTLRILCTVLAADGGTARVGGVDVGADPMSVRGRIGVLPHNSNLYPNLTARENIAYFAALQGLSGAGLEAAVDRMVVRLGIEPFADRRAKGFSQGQRIRVALARALVHDPDTLILDEPSNGLDVMASRVLREVVRERRDAGCCVLFSSHVMQEVAVLCDRIARIHSESAGEIVTGGSAFNIKAESLRLGDLDEADVRELLGQHTSETGQKFTEGALAAVWNQSRGQPWLVNALAYEACFRNKANRDRSRTKESLDSRPVTVWGA